MPRKDDPKVFNNGKGLFEIKPRVRIKTREDLARYYTPGVAKLSQNICDTNSRIWQLSGRSNLVAVVSDGTSVLGLGDIGPEAAYPVMAGKALLFKEFANIDAIPICLATKDIDEVVQTIKNISPSFGGINLEDIAAPHCFEIEDRLQDLGIPVMHDDQHGTAIVVLAGLINAAKLLDRPIESLKIVINGAGAAGTAIAKIIARFTENQADIIVCDSKGVISTNRNDLNKFKLNLVPLNRKNISGDLHDAIKGSDVFIGVSKGNLLDEEMVKSMAKDPIIFAMANPTPEIMPDVAIKSGAKIIATGRSDFPNQINNVLVFPGVFRGALDAAATKITDEMKMAAAIALSDLVKKPSPNYIIPSAIDKKVSSAVAKAVRKTAINQKVIRQC